MDWPMEDNLKRLEEFKKELSVVPEHAVRQADLSEWAAPRRTLSTPWQEHSM